MHHQTTKISLEQPWPDCLYTNSERASKHCQQENKNKNEKTPFVLAV